MAGRPARHLAWPRSWLAPGAAHVADATARRRPAQGRRRARASGFVRLRRTRCPPTARTARRYSRHRPDFLTEIRPVYFGRGADLLRPICAERRTAGRSQTAPLQFSEPRKFFREIFQRLEKLAQAGAGYFFCCLSSQCWATACTSAALSQRARSMIGLTTRLVPWL